LEKGEGIHDGETTKGKRAFVRSNPHHTDEKTMLTIHEIHSYFPEHLQVGIGAVRDDVHSLEKSTAFPVIAVQPKNGLVKHYHYDGRIFAIHELRLLMDAISAAKFIPRQDTNKLLGKIRKLTSQSLGAELTNELYVAEESTKGAAKIISTVQLLHEAIHDQHVEVGVESHEDIPYALELIQQSFDYQMEK